MRSGSRTSLSAGVRGTLKLSRLFVLRRSGGQDVRDPIPKKLIDDLTLLFYYHLNTGKEVIDNI
jgi:hypothetical protein